MPVHNIESKIKILKVQIHDDSVEFYFFLLQPSNEIYVFNSTHNGTIADIIEHPPCKYTCELTNEAGYVVYSALGSFYIPMLVMLFFYWRIYKAAVRTTRAINQGFRTTKGNG